MTRRSLIAAVFCSALVFASLPARAAHMADYSAAAFAQAQEQNKPILLHVEASWCPTCAKQRPILARLSADPAFADLQILNVDFDSQKDVVRALGVRMQSTMIVYHGKDERGRATGDTNADSIRALLDKANS